MSKIDKVTLHGVTYTVDGSGSGPTPANVWTRENLVAGANVSITPVQQGSSTNGEAQYAINSSVPAATATTLGGVMLEYDATTNTLNIKTH